MRKVPRRRAAATARAPMRRGGSGGRTRATVRQVHRSGSQDPRPGATPARSTSWGRHVIMESIIVVPRTPCAVCRRRTEDHVDMVAHDRSRTWPHGRYFTCRTCNPRGRPLVRYDDIF